MSTSNFARSVLGRKDLLTDVTATKVVPGNPNRSTICRWRLKGVPTPDGGRLYLQFIRAGRKAFIRPEDLEYFLTRLAELEQQGQREHVTRIRPPRRRTSSRHAQAEEEAKRMGI